MTYDYSEWATTWAPSPSSERVDFHVAAKAYDDVDGRLGDEAEHDEFFARVLWLETAIRLARLGWTIAELEDRRWPLRGNSRMAALLAGL